MSSASQAILADFLKRGKVASYHYADDSGAEWAHGDAEKAHALALFDAHPELHAEMRYLAHGFLWSLKSVRPSAKETQS